MDRNRKKNRSNAPVLAGLVACLAFAYGFSHQNPLFQWWIPIALVGGAVAWALWPRAAKPGGTGEQA
jgi:hypothetical protein